MKKIISMITMTLLFSLSSLFANPNTTHGSPHDMINNFEHRGGSAQGAKILQDKYAQVDKTILKQTREQIKNIKAEIKTIVLASTFDANAFKSKTKELHTLRLNRMQKMLAIQTDTLTQLSQADRAIYFKILMRMNRTHGNNYHSKHNPHGDNDHSKNKSHENNH